MVGQLSYCQEGQSIISGRSIQKAQREIERCRGKDTAPKDNLHHDLLLSKHHFQGFQTSNGSILV